MALCLTVIIRNNAPFIHLQDPPTHRSVSINFTESQMKLLELHLTDRVGVNDHFEEISQCFIEDKQTELHDDFISLKDYISYIDKLVGNFGVEIDFLAWNEIKRRLQ